MVKKIKNEILSNIVDGGYDFGTGVWSYFNNKLETVLNEKGEYVTRLKNNNATLNDEEVRQLCSLNIHLSNKNESTLGKELFADNENVLYSKNLGYYTSLFVGHVTEGKYRENGSSGGLTTWILTELMKNHLVDKVIHVKKTNNSSGLIFQYGISNNLEELEKDSKTKYYPVEMTEMLHIIKSTPGKYAVVALPSFAMELRLLAKKDKIIKDRVKFIVGLVCGHQKSTKFAEVLAWQCGIKPGNLENINFRKKLSYGKSSDYAIEVTGKINGVRKTINKPMRELYGGDWGKGLFKVRASDFTDDVMNETADVTLGDAWLPEYISDQKGNNIVVIRNRIIESLVNRGVEQGRLNLNSVDEKVIFNSQKSHFRHTRDELSYRLYLKQKKGEWIPKKRVKPKDNIPYLRKKIQVIREKYCCLTFKKYDIAVKKGDLNYFYRHMWWLDFEYSLFYKLMKIKKILKNIKK